MVATTTFGLTFSFHSALTRPFRSYFVDIGPGWARSSNKIRTIEMLTDDEIRSSKDESLTERISTTTTTTGATCKPPLVLVHGFAVGLGTWILNLDSLASNCDRKIYAFDLIGFGRSSRPTFDLEGNIDDQFIDTFEKWRQDRKIDKFILLGHSFGGYLSACYALKYPERVCHLILADPWGVPDRKKSRYDIANGFPIWYKLIRPVLRQFSPLVLLRAAGPFGLRLTQRTSVDMPRKYAPKLKENAGKIVEYIYHCNAQRVSGELAFKALTIPFAWAKNPLIYRLTDLREPISVSFIYGSKSWVDRSTGASLREHLGPNRVSMNIIEGAGHHVNADNYAKFNEIVQEICSRF